MKKILKVYFYKTLLRLGIKNIIRVIIHRFFKKIKYYKEKPNYDLKAEKKYFNGVKPYQDRNIGFNSLWDNAHGYFGIKYPLYKDNLNILNF